MLLIPLSIFTGSFAVSAGFTLRLLKCGNSIAASIIRTFYILRERADTSSDTLIAFSKPIKATSWENVQIKVIGHSQAGGEGTKQNLCWMKN